MQDSDKKFNIIPIHNDQKPRTDGSAKGQVDNQQEIIEEADNMDQLMTERDLIDKEKKPADQNHTSQSKLSPSHFNLEAQLKQSHHGVFKPRGHLPDDKAYYYFARRSLFCLGDNNKFRKIFVWIATWNWFENFIMVAIILNSFLLASTDYTDRLDPDYESSWTPIQEQIDLVFNIIFIAEFIIKVIAMGFVLGKGSYLREPWNCLDFFIVCISVIGMLPMGGGSEGLKALRTFRILRPLRSINKMPQLAAQIGIILASLPGLLRVFFFIIFIFCIFAIFGTNQFMGQQYQFCRSTEEGFKDEDGVFSWPKSGEEDDGIMLCSTDDQCREAFPDDEFAICGTVWEKHGLDPLEHDGIRDIELIMYGIPGFDNVGQGFLTIFQILTLESWVYLMYNFSDAGSTFISVCFFILVVLLGAFFTMNLVLAIIVDSFDKQKQEKGDSEEDVKEAINQSVSRRQHESLTLNRPNPGKTAVESLDQNQRTQPNQANELDQIQIKVPNDNHVNVMMQDEYDFEEQQWEKDARLRAQTNKVYQFAFNLVTSVSFNFFIFILIIGNTITLAVYTYDQSDLKDNVLDIFNEFFTWIFLLEMVLKIIGLGLNNYIKDAYNLFDAVIVVISLIDWVISKIPNLNAGSALNAFRALRLLRMLKLSKSWKALGEILRKMGTSVKGISNFSLLLLLFLYIFALLGMELFANQALYDEDENLIAGSEAIQALYASGDYYTFPRDNFNNIGFALTSIFIVIIGEDWNWSMYQWARAYGTDSVLWYYVAVFFFLLIMILGNIVLFSLFTAILLESFDGNGDEEEEDEENENELEADKTDDAPELSKWQRLSESFKDAFGKKKRVKKMMVLEDANAEKITQQDKNSEEPKAKGDSVQSLSFDMPEGRVSKARLKRAERLRETPLTHLRPSKEESFKSMLLRKNSTLREATEEVQLLPLEGRALFCLGPENIFRIYVYKLVENWWFQQTILLLIIISTITLALETPLDNPDGALIQTLEKIDLFMTITFTFEAAVKIIAAGFVLNGKKSYFREAWNILDFVIVVSALLGILAGDSIDIGFIKALRILKILRPLRIIARDKGLKIAIVSLGRSIPNIVNLQVIVLFFIFLLSILQTTLFSGTFFACETGHLSVSAKQADQNIVTMWDCINYGGEWLEPPLNFDTTLTSMLTLVTIQTTEGWIDVMWNFVDAVEPYYQPQENNNPFIIVYTMILVIIICMLFIELFVGVVIETFNSQKEFMMGNSELERPQAAWARIFLLVTSAKPKKRFEVTFSFRAPRNMMIRVTEHRYFDTTIMVCILLNTFVLGFVWYMQSETVKDILEVCNYIFVVIFTVEAVMKIWAQQRDYFFDAWNIFDFTVVAATLVILVITWIGIGEGLEILGTILRTLRIGRVFRLIKRQKKLYEIFQTLLEAMPGMASLGLLLMLFIFMFSIIGMAQFALVDLNPADEMGSHVNFQSFGAAFLTLVRCSTGEAWNSIMLDSSRPYSIMNQCVEEESYEKMIASGLDPSDPFHPRGCGTGIAIGFHLLFQVIISQVFLNLFIAIIIDAFFGQTDIAELPIGDKTLDDFVAVWSKYDRDATGFIAVAKLDRVLTDLAKIEESEERVTFFSKNMWPKLIDPQDREFRNRQIISLALPTYNNAKDVMFYDLIIQLSFQSIKYHYDQIEVDKRKKLLKILKTMDGKLTGIGTAYDDTLGTLHDRNADLSFNQHYADLLKKHDEKDCKIDLVCEMKLRAKKIKKQYEANVDTNLRIMYGEDRAGLGPSKFGREAVVEEVEIYTTTHLSSVHMIHDFIVEYLRRSQNRGDHSPRNDMDRERFGAINEVSSGQEATNKESKKGSLLGNGNPSSGTQAQVADLPLTAKQSPLLIQTRASNENQEREQDAVLEPEAKDDESSFVPDQDWRNLR